jgi:hypothetical protein
LPTKCIEFKQYFCFDFYGKTTTKQNTLSVFHNKSSKAKKRNSLGFQCLLGLILTISTNNWIQQKDSQGLSPIKLSNLLFMESHFRGIFLKILSKILSNCEMTQFFLQSIRILCFNIINIEVAAVLFRATNGPINKTKSKCFHF